MKRNIFCLMLGLMCSTWLMALEAGDYYLLNKASGRYLNFGGSGGIMAVFSPHGKALSLIASDGGFVIDPHMKTSTHRLDANGSAEGAATVFTITQQDGGGTTPLLPTARTTWGMMSPMSRN